MTNLTISGQAGYSATAPKFRADTMSSRFALAVLVVLGATSALADDMKMPAGYKIPAHNHPTTESVTVVSGNFHIGMGDRLDEAKGIELTAGAYGEAPAKMNHYAWMSSPTIVQVHGQGPFAITYVNPADDPSKK